MTRKGSWVFLSFMVSLLKGFPLGGSCRPQAADEGGVRVASLLTGSLRRLSPHPSAGGAADTFSPTGRRLLSARKASPSGEAAARRRLMRAKFAWSPFNGQPPQALPSSVRGRGRGHLLPQGEKAPVSSKAFPRDCASSKGFPEGLRPQARVGAQPPKAALSA